MWAIVHRRMAESLHLEFKLVVRTLRLLSVINVKPITLPPHIYLLAHWWVGYFW